MYQHIWPISALLDKTVHVLELASVFISESVISTELVMEDNRQWLYYSNWQLIIADAKHWNWECGKLKYLVDELLKWIQI